MNGTVTQLGSATRYQYDKPDASILEWFINPTPNFYTIHLRCAEFTSLCPKTGQPDFATIIIDYIPCERAVESKSLKLYLGAYRQYGAFHEACINKIADDLMDVIKPIYLRIEGQFNSRGGIAIWPIVERGSRPA